MTLVVAKMPISVPLLDYETLREELTQTERSLNTLRLELHQKQTAYAAELDQETSDIRRLLTQLNSAQQQIEHEVESFHHTIDSLTAECQTLKSTLNDKNSAVRDLQWHLDYFQESITDKDKYLAEIQKQSSDQQYEVATKDEA